MEKEELIQMNVVDRKLKTILKNLNDEYDISESPAIAAAIQDLYEVKEAINRLIS